MRSIVFSIALLLTNFLYAQSILDENNSAAITQTQQILINATQREAALDTEKARTVDQNVTITSMGNQNLKNDIYGVSSELMPWLSDIGKGDAGSMQKLLQEAQSNPQVIENFYNRMPAAQKEKVKAISKQIETLRSGAANIPISP